MLKICERLKISERQNNCIIKSKYIDKINCDFDQTNWDRSRYKQSLHEILNKYINRFLQFLMTHECSKQMKLKILKILDVKYDFFSKKFIITIIVSLSVTIVIFKLYYNTIN